MSDKEKVFADGVFVSKPSENAPDFVKAKISIKSKDFFEFAKKHTNKRGYINLDVLESQKGPYYAQLDEWEKPEGLEGEDADKAKKAREAAQALQDAPQKGYEGEEINPDDIPF